MRLLRIAFQRETALPMLGLLLASGVGVVLVIARIAIARDISYGFLVWNLFLAWLPLIFALLAQERFREGRGRTWQFAGFCVAWLLFFPNAPYIFTDLVHVTNRFFSHFWVDLTLVLLVAFTGLMLGFVSLYLMQTMVARRFGRLASWGFIAAVAVLSGFGIYLGRFLRFNSWDVLFRPRAIYDSVATWAAMENGRANAFLFPALFATFLFLAYMMVYTLTHLQPVQVEEVIEAEVELA